MPSPQQTDDPTQTIASGMTDLTQHPLNQQIINAGNPTNSSAGRMSFTVPSSTASQEVLVFSLNPQIVRRTKKVVESEFPTMNAWHTYRWMEEPTIWEIAGYAGFDGPSIRRTISLLDGQTNVIWSYPYLMQTNFGWTGNNPNSGTPGVNVKIISTSMPYDATQSPYGEYYTIVMRELSTTVLNVASDAYGTQRLAQIITQPNFSTSLVSAANVKSITLSPQLNDLNKIATYLYSNHFSKIGPDISPQVIYMQAVNHLSVTSWSSDYPVSSQDGSTIQSLFYDAG